MISRNIYSLHSNEQFFEYFLFSLSFLASGMVIVFSTAVGFCVALWRTRLKLTFWTAGMLSVIFMIFFLDRQFDQAEKIVLVGFSVFQYQLF